jgi:signal transduction histidine kinase
MLSELATAVVVIITAVSALARLASERSYMDRYVFAPLVDIGDASATVDELGELVADGGEHAAEGARDPVLRLRAFVNRYQRDWETGTSNLPEALRLRAELARQGELRLLEREHQVVGDASQALSRIERTIGLTGAPPDDPPLRRRDVVQLENALVQLNLLNLRYVQVAYKAFERTHGHVTAFFIAASAAGLLAQALIGLAVRRAIAPRVHRMVEAVRRFREMGVQAPIDDPGDDDLAALAHALSLSLRSVAERDKERARFLAVAAHELKTPLTTLKGFAQAALAHRDEPAVRDRALAILDRQATRLARLAQDLLWAARAEAGRLPFKPTPIDLDALARRVIGEIGVVYKEQDFRLASRGDAHILGDAGLLEQSFWNLFVQAATLATGREPVIVGIEGRPARVTFAVSMRGGDLPEDLDALAEPFATVQFERPGEGLRSTGVGLYLVREIARLHDASFRIERTGEDAIVASLEFRR